MKLCRLQGGATGLVIDTNPISVIDVGASLDPFARSKPADASVLSRHLVGQAQSWHDLIDDWDRAGEALGSLETWASAEPAQARIVRPSDLEPPLPDPCSRIFAIGANFASHAARAMGAIEGDMSAVDQRARQLVAAKQSGAPPWGFNVLPGTVIGHDHTIRRPNGVRKLDFEGEVAVVLRCAPGVAPSVWGVAPWNDLSIRDKYFSLGPRVDEGPLTWSLQKNFDTGSACGPWMTVDEKLDPAGIDISLRVNGLERQRGNTSDMVYGFEEVIAHLGAFLTLRSGDMIASGTPAGTAFEEGVEGRYLADGDIVEVELAGIATLRNRVADDADRAGGRERVKDIERAVTTQPLERRPPMTLEPATSQTPSLPLAGRTAIVTGGASGIGLAMVQCLATRGASVMAVDVGDPVPGLDEASQFEGQVRYQRTDVTSCEELGEAASACLEAFGSIDMLFNNAGVTRASFAHEMSEDDWRLVVDVDLTAVWLGSKVVLPHMMKQARGAIVNTASTLGLIAQHKMPAYVAAKSGVVGLTKQLALDYGRHGIRTNCICPGPTKTPNVARSYGEVGAMTGRGQYLFDSVPLGRMAEPSEIASAAVFLASDDASFVNGATLVVDGGHSVHTGPTWTQALFDEG